MADDSGVNARLVVALQADLSQLRKAFEQAGKAADGALLGIENRGKKTKERLEQNLELIKLTQQLDVARIHGNSKLVEKLSEEVALRKTINTLTAQGVKAEEARVLAEAHVMALAHARAKREGVGGALRSLGGSTRLATFEEGGARLGIYGGALEKLGAAGLIAAGGLAAAALAGEEVHKALEFANQIDNVARRLHVTTDALQEYRFAIEEVGGSTEGADEALGQFSSQLGKAQAGLPKALRAFKELGFTPEQVKSFKTVEEALDAVTEKIAGLGKNVQKDAVIDQLGLTGLKPLIEAGVEKMRELRQEIRDAGGVMDSELIRRGAILDKQMEALNKVISVQLKEAFIELGPVIIPIMKYIAEMASQMNDFVQSFRELENRSTHTLQRQAGESRDLALKDDRQAAFFHRMGGPIGALGEFTNKMGAQLAREDEAKIIAQLQGRVDPKAPAATGGGNLIDQSKTSSPKDHTDSTAKSIEDGLLEAQKRLTEAQAALTGDTWEHARLEKQAIEDEWKRQAVDLNAQRASVDKGVREGTINAEKAKQLRSKIIQTGFADEAAKNARQRNVDIGAAIAEDQKALERTRIIAGFDSQTRQVAIALSVTRQERLRLELEQLAAAKELADRERREKRAAAALRNTPDGSIVVQGVDREQAAADRANRAEQDRLKAQNLSPWEAWAKGGTDAAKNVGDSLQSEAVKGMDAFNDGIANAIANGKSMGEVFKSIFQSMEADLIKYLLKQSEIALFGDGSKGSLGGTIGTTISSFFGVPGHASGTDSSPGGWHMVGEHGPELMNVRPGAGVISNSNLAALTRMPDVRGGGGVTVIQPHYNDFKGAIVTADLMAQMDQKAQQAAQAGAALGHQRTMARLQQRNSNTLR